MNNFQPINNGDSGLEARIKINNLGAKALDTEHETNASAHPGFISHERTGSRGSENPLNAEQTENIGSQLAFNTYGYDGSPWAKVKYIGAYPLNALTIKRIIAKYGGNETSMPSYWGINEEYIGGVNDRESNFFGGIFILSRNEESNKVAYPYKVILFSGKDGAKKAYFKNGVTSELTEWIIMEGGSDSVEPYYIQAIPSNPTNAQMEAATGGARGLRDAIEAGRPVYGYWDNNFQGLVLAANINTSGNIISLVLPDPSNGRLRMLVWVDGSDPTEMLIGDPPVYSTTGLYALTSSSTTGEINAAIGSWDNLTAALQNGNTIIDTTAEYVRSVSGFYKTAAYIVLHLLTPADTQSGNKEVRIEIVKDGAELVLMKTSYNIFTDTAEGKIPFVAANTGDSTDAGKLPALGSAGKLNKAVLPSIPGFKERKTIISASDLDTDIYIPANEEVEIYDIQIENFTPGYFSIFLPYDETLRGRIKIRLQQKGEEGMAGIFPIESYSPVDIQPFSSSGNVSVWVIEAEMYSEGFWSVIINKPAVPGQSTFFN